MKLKAYITLAATALSALTAMAEPYRVTVPLGTENEGEMVYIRNFETGAGIDSALVDAKGVAVMEGQADEPVLARIMVGPARGSIFILEPGSMSVSEQDGMVFGTMLNDRLRNLRLSERTLTQAYQTAQTSQEREAIEAQYNKMCLDALAENHDNPIGVVYFSSWVQDAQPREALELLAKYPSLDRSVYIQKLRKAIEAKAATSVGGKMVDFEVVYDGKTSRLSDYVGKGKYVLVDFWASWCGPCMRQIPVIKELQSELGPKGLEILGVAVWDEPQATIQAIESHGITWPCIIDAQKIPTDLYGISGIPCIILFGPDGEILSRDRQGDELKAEVRAAMGVK